MNKIFTAETGVDSQNSMTKSATVRTTKMVDKIIREFNKVFKRQIEHTFEVKKASIQKAITNKCTDNYTKDVFERDIAGRIDLLLSSAHFREAIQAKGLDAFNAASHFVLLGWQKLEDCILRGGYNDIQNYEEWAQPMFDRNRMELYMPHIKDMLKGQPKFALVARSSETTVPATASAVA